MTRVALVGLGLIGRQRLAALETLRAGGVDVEIVATMDPVIEGPNSCSSLEDLMSRGPDLVILSTPHDTTVECLRVLLPTGVRVLAEKPIGRTGEEFREIADMRRSDQQVMVGLNYLYFEGVEALVKDARAGAFGDPIRLTIEMGHGGSPGDDATWKLDPVRAGGGALLDPGIHLFDIASVLGGPSVSVASCSTSARFWKTGIEEDAVALLTSSTVPTVVLQVSITQWRSRFRVEYVGTDGYGIVDGRGRSYGAQTYTRGRRWGFLGGISQRDSEKCVVSTDCENCFIRELQDVLSGTPGAYASMSFERMGRAMDLVEACRTNAKLTTR